MYIYTYIYIYIYRPDLGHKEVRILKSQLYITSYGTCIQMHYIVIGFRVLESRETLNPKPKTLNPNP